MDKKRNTKSDTRIAFTLHEFDTPNPDYATENPCYAEHTHATPEVGGSVTFVCTRRRGHRGMHRAGVASRLIASWEQA